MAESQRPAALSGKAERKAATLHPLVNVEETKQRPRIRRLHGNRSPFAFTPLAEDDLLTSGGKGGKLRAVGARARAGVTQFYVAQHLVMETDQRIDRHVDADRRIAAAGRGFGRIA